MPETITASELAEHGCPWCDDYDGDDVAIHAAQAHRDEWERIDYENDQFKSVRVTESAKDRADRARQDDESWSEFLLRCAENPPRPLEVVPADAVVERLNGDG